MESLNDYVRQLDAALKHGRTYVNSNRDMAHAKVVVFLGICHAKEKVLLLSEKLDWTLYGMPHFMQEVSGFLDRGGRMEVLVETDLQADHPMMELSDRSSKLSIRKVPENIVEKYEYNFMVVDDIGYRFERDRRRPAAYVSFNDKEDKEMIEMLKSMFENLGRNATPLPA